MASSSGLYFREELPEVVARELDAQLARIWGVLLEEHADDGTHLDNSSNPLFQSTRVIIGQLSASQTISTGVETKILFDSISRDDFVEYDQTNDRIIPKIGGLWMFMFVASMQSLNGRLTLLVRENESTASERTALYPSSGLDVAGFCATIYDISGVGDYVQFHVLHNHGSDRSIDDNTFFYAVYLGPTQSNSV